MVVRRQGPPHKSGSDSESDEASSSSSHSGSIEREVEDSEHEEEEQVPKFAQYVDSDEADEDASEDDEDQSESDIESVAGKGVGSDDADLLHREDAISKKLGSIPFATLARARNAVRRGEETDETSDSEVDEFEEERACKAGEGGEEKSEKKKIASQHDLQKRSNKHAPTEMSTRKPVSRRRMVVEGASNNSSRRDPRFSSLSASVPNADLFRSSYGFLREQQSSEVAELKSVFKKLKRQEANHAGSKAKSELALSIREEKEKVEMALKRAEGQENERRRRERENHVIQREKKAIQERVKQGGKPFHLKESAKKQLILKDKFDRLSKTTEDTSNGASSRKDLKRAIERRRKKNAAKERREMPIGEVSSSHPQQRAIPKRKRLASDLATGDRKRDRRG